MAEAEIDRLLARHEPAHRSARRLAADESIADLSARNRLHGFIEEVRVDGLLAQIRLRVGDQSLTAVITADAVHALNFKRGDDALAIIKSTEVMIARATAAPAASGQAAGLHGKQRGSRASQALYAQSPRCSRTSPSNGSCSDPVPRDIRDGPVIAQAPSGCRRECAAGRAGPATPPPDDRAPYRTPGPDRTFRPRQRQVARPTRSRAILRIPVQRQQHRHGAAVGPAEQVDLVAHPPRRSERTRGRMRPILDDRLHGGVLAVSTKLVAQHLEVVRRIVIGIGRTVHPGKAVARAIQPSTAPTSGIGRLPVVLANTMASTPVNPAGVNMQRHVGGSHGRTSR